MGLMTNLWKPWGTFNRSLRQREDEPLLDPAGRLRVSNPRTIFNGNLTLGKSPYIWDEVIGGAATSTVVSEEVAVDMEVINNGDYVIRQTMERYNYQAGKAQKVELTGKWDTAAGAIFRAGLFCSGYVDPYLPEDGVYFASENGVMYCVICKGGVEHTKVPQSAWNQNTMDGTGDGKINIDSTKMQFFFIEYEWLGVGPVKWGFHVDGIPVYCHIEYHANVRDSIYMRNSTQPVRYELRSTGGNATARAQCNAVSQDGGEENFGIVGAADTDGTALSIAVGASRMVVAARINPDTPNHQAQMVGQYLYNSTVNTAFQWRLCWNPMFGVQPAWNTVPFSAIDVALGVDTDIPVTDFGFVMESGYDAQKFAGAASKETSSTLSLGTRIDGTPNVIALVATSITGTCSIFGGMQMRQLL